MSKKLLGGVVEESDKEAFKELKAQYDETQKLCENMSKTFSERLEEAKKADKELGIERVDELPDNFSVDSFNNKDLKFKSGESLNEVDNRFNSFIEDVNKFADEYENNESYNNY